MVDDHLIRAAVDQAELSALRLALYQATGDPTIAAIPLENRVVRGGAGVLPVVPEQYHDRLKEEAVRFLRGEAAGHVHRTPSREEIDSLIMLAHGETVADEVLAARRDLLAFAEHTRQTLPPEGGVRVPHDFHVIVIGAGFSGIAMGVQLDLLGIPYTVLERRHEVGGVWSTNTYPDARVDTLSATYQFSFEKDFAWSEYFARQPEVRGYLEHVAKKHGVFDHILFDQDVRAATWDEDAARWSLDVRTPEGLRNVRVNVVVSAAGLFAVPREVTIPGAGEFGGELVHTTRWDDQRSVRGKRVAVVGNGSTGVQLLGRVAEEADHVSVFQRTPQWISPRERYGEPMAPEAQWLLTTMPYYWNWSRYVAMMPLLDSYELLVPDDDWIAGGGKINERSDAIRAGLVAYIRSQLGDRQDLLDELVPDYAPIARRPVVDNGWYRALTRDDVELVTDPIDRITATGIRTADGRDRDLDMIIAAIGFDTDRYLWPTDYRGRGGVGLHERWAETGAEAHTGITVPGFPNLFILYGPNSQPISGGNTLPMWFEVWSSYIAQCLLALFDSGSERIEVREEVCADYNRRLQEQAARLIYLTDEGSRSANYYNNKHGKLGVNVSFDFEEYYRLSSSPDLQDFDLR
ncbi:MAG: NAD(P)/FAD-dependent oxidoreductase [Pseudonocardia sp.]|nr:NAD(P)/FAD-dependent oxidoreductase [Pseudonocardia sp.]